MSTEEEKRDRSKFYPQLSIRITPEQKDGLDAIPWGLKNQLFRSLIDTMLFLIEKEGLDHIVARIIGKTLTLEDILDNINASAAQKILDAAIEHKVSELKEFELRDQNG